MSYRIGIDTLWLKPTPRVRGIYFESVRSHWHR